MPSLRRSPPKRWRLALSRPVMVATLMLGLAACESTLHVRGWVPDEERLAQIEPNRSNRAEVETILGSPSTRSTFDDTVWYYMSEKNETVAFFEPTLIERKIVAITFTENDIVDDVVTYTEADGQEVQIVSRTTPTAGNEVTILQQLFGNIGRFSQDEN